MRRIRVLFLAPVAYFKGGAERSLFDLMSNRSIDPVLVTPGLGSLAAAAEERGVPVKHLDFVDVLSIHRPFNFLDGHDADHGEADESSDARCVAFEVASEATVATDPRERSFDDPTLGQHVEARSVDRLTICNAPAPVRHSVGAIASRVAAIGEDAFDERE